jgi:hypothetical protein
LGPDEAVSEVLRAFILAAEAHLDVGSVQR